MTPVSLEKALILLNLEKLVALATLHGVVTPVNWEKPQLAATLYEPIMSVILEDYVGFVSPGQVVNSKLYLEEAPASVTLEEVTASLTSGKSGPVCVSLEKAWNTASDNCKLGMEVILTLKSGHLGEKGL